MIFITRLLFWADGFTLSPSLMLVHPRAKNDAGLIEHERAHQRQMRGDGWLRFVLRYACSRRWRCLYEVEAYRTSIASGMRPEVAARLLATKYRLNITDAQALDLLQHQGSNK